MKLPTIKSKNDIIDLVNEIGILPAFKCEIEGFSVEENIDSRFWFSEEEGFWEWKGPVIQEGGFAYGKFFKGRAAFVTLENYAEFANYRRDGFDFDSLVDCGMARQKDIPVYNALYERNSALSKELKSALPSTKGFEEIMTRLQMSGYVVISDFVYETKKDGTPYGWGITCYETPEFRFGSSFTDIVYKHKEQESKRILISRLQKIFPDINETIISKFLG